MTVLVLGSDTPIGLTVIRELGGHGVVVHAIGRTGRSIGGASRFAQGEHVRPKGPLAHWLPGLIERVGAKALFAISETDLIELAALPQTIGGCRILTPSAAPLGMVLDKTVTLAMAAAVGIDVPSHWQPIIRDDVPARAGALSYPVVLKWSDPPAVADVLAACSIDFVKSEIAANASALIVMLRRYDAIGRWPMVQEYCAGSGFGQMIHMAKGRAVLNFQHRRIHEWPPEGGVSTLCEAVSLSLHSGQMAMSEALLRAIGWEGPAMVEYRNDPLTGRYWLMEVNGRFWGSLPLASASGARFAWEQYRRDVLGQTEGVMPPRVGLKARYMVPETRRLLRVLFRPSKIGDPAFRPTPWRDVACYVAGFFSNRTRYYVFRLDDPGPFFRDLANMIVKTLKRRSA